MLGDDEEQTPTLEVPATLSPSCLKVKVVEAETASLFSSMGKRGNAEGKGNIVMPPALIVLRPVRPLIPIPVRALRPFRPLSPLTLMALIPAILLRPLGPALLGDAETGELFTVGNTKSFGRPDAKAPRLSCNCAAIGNIILLNSGDSSGEKKILGEKC